MMRNLLICCVISLCSAVTAHAQLDLNYGGSVTVNAGSGDLAPHYIMANRWGTVTQPYSTLAAASVEHEMDTTRRWSFGFGFEAWAGWSSSTTYDQVIVPATEPGDEPLMGTTKQHPARAWVQQLYAMGKYRGVFLELGQRQRQSLIVNHRMSSGDLIMSGNARPGMGFAAGFVNFQNIPFTHGWVQIRGEIGYYRLGDGDWLKHHYNHYNYFVNTGYWFNYKNFYLRTRPDKPLVVTIGGQASCQFGGTAVRYEKGRVIETNAMPSNFKAFFRALIAGSGGTGSGDFFVEGNHIGSWDASAVYTFKSGHVLRAYWQSPWEDGSGIGKQNGFDGLYGLEYRAPKPCIIDNVVIEYLDLTNQSGPIHWAPGDHPDTPLTDEATGADNYYNNYTYNGYESHGLNIGTPMVQGPIYNYDGYMRFNDNMMRGFHVAVAGHATAEVAYRLMASYRKSWGTPIIPRTSPVEGTSFMVEGVYSPKRLAGLSLTAQFALDRGKLQGDNTGVLFSVAYHGNLTLGKR